jgi:hypothetical protein
MTTAVNFVKPFTDPNKISFEQFTTIVGGKFFSKNKQREVRTYGLLNSKVFDMDSKVQDHEKSPTYRWVFDYTPAVNSNGKPFRNWTNLAHLDKKQAQWLIKHMLALPEKDENRTVAAPVTDPEFTPNQIMPTAHQGHTLDSDTVAKSPGKDVLPDGRYHLEGSGGFYVNITTGKNGRKYSTVEY